MKKDSLKNTSPLLVLFLNSQTRWIMAYSQRSQDHHHIPPHIAFIQPEFPINFQRVSTRPQRLSSWPLWNMVYHFPSKYKKVSLSVIVINDQSCHILSSTSGVVAAEQKETGSITDPCSPVKNVFSPVPGPVLPDYLNHLQLLHRNSRSVYHFRSKFFFKVAYYYIKKNKSGIRYHLHQLFLALQKKHQFLVNRKNC